MSINPPTAFTPKVLVSTKVGGVHVNLYPIFNELMGVHKHTYAHHVNKTNLLLLDTTPRQMITALGHQIGQSTFIKGEMSNFSIGLTTIGVIFNHSRFSASITPLAIPSLTPASQATLPFFFLFKMVWSEFDLICLRQSQH